MVYLDRDTREAARNGLRPATIARLVKADQAHADADFTIQDVGVYKVSVVACVCTISTNNNARIYTLEDGSGGSIRCKMWKGKDGDVFDSNMIDSIQQTDYIHVVGIVKKYNGINEIVAFAIYKILDYHQVFYHQLDALIATLTFERGPPPSVSSNPPILTHPHGEHVAGSSHQPPSDDTTHAYDLSELGDSLDNSRIMPEPLVHLSDSESERADTFVTPQASRSPSPDPPKSQTIPESRPHPRRDPLSHLSSLQRAILVQIKNSEDLYFEGVPIGLIAKAVHFQLLEELDDAIVALIDEELIYHTLDYNHFLSI